MSLNDRAHVLSASGFLRRSRSRWRLFAFVALAIAVLALLGRLALPTDNGPGDHIARVIINGVISTDRDRLAELNDIAEDEDVKAVIISINSPGGTTAGGEELFEAIGHIRAQKPVVAVIDELGASAAYMTAIASDEIFARRLSIVGSIGVLFQHVDAGKLLDTIGIDLDKVQTGPLKAEPDLDDPLAGATRQSLQTLVDDSFEWFVDIVADRRQMDRAEVLKLSDGRIVTGRMALENGLIDAIGGEEEAIEWLESDKNIEADLPVFTRFPLPESGTDRLLHLVSGEVARAIGLPGATSMTLDGLVSLWQAGFSQ